MKAFVSLALLGVVGSAHAVIWGFSAPIIDGSQEVPPTGSNAYGTGSFTVDTDTWLVVGSMTLNDIVSTQNSITMAHIHEAPAGSNGPVRFDIWGNQVAGSPISTGPGDLAVVWSGTLPGTQAQRTAILNAMIAGNTYFNVHTTSFPGGEIRGQIECNGVVPEPASLSFLALGGLAALARRRFKKA